MKDLEPTKYLSQTEVEALERVLEMTRESDARNSLLIELLLKTGARVSEIVGSNGLKLEDLDRTNRVVVIRGLKGSNSRRVALKRELFARLWAYAEKIGPGQRLFPLTVRRVEQIWEDYRPAPKKLHSLRHTSAILTYHKSKDLQFVRRKLGHKNIQNTMVYASVDYTDKESRKWAL